MNPFMKISEEDTQEIVDYAKELAVLRKQKKVNISYYKCINDSYMNF